MIKVLQIVFFPITFLSYVLIYLYKLIISPLIPHTCIYYPSCSTYMVKAIKEWGVFKGVALGVKRLVKCTPKHKGGIDLVPLNIKGGKKWIF